MRALASRDPADPRASGEAIALRRWFLVVSELPWVVMGWAILIGGVPSIWHFFRPQDQNPYVLTWFATLFLISVAVVFWVFFRGEAEKVVRLQPFEIKWSRASFSGTKQGTVELTLSRVRCFAVIAPIWMAAGTLLVWSMDAPVPK
jgi:hypothetical protein